MPQNTATDIGSSAAANFDGVTPPRGNIGLALDEGTMRVGDGATPGGLKFLSDKTLSSPVGANAIGWQRGGANTVKRLLSEKIGALQVSARDFDVTTIGARAAVQAAFASVFDRIITMPDEFTVDGLTVPGYSKLDGQGSGQFYRASGPSNPLVEVLTNDGGIQTIRRTQLTDLSVNGTSNGTNTGVGYMIRNNAVLSLMNLGARNCQVGYYFDRAQFTCASNVKAYDNDIGFYLRPSYDDGGANSISFLHSMAAGNILGWLIDNTNNQYPQGNIALFNPQFLGNKVCALAVVGLNNAARTQVHIYDMAPEANGLSQATAGYPAGPASFTYNNITVPRCSGYFKFASVSIFGGSVAEYGATNPCFILRSSLLHLEDITGYGGPTSTFIDADNDSQVLISGYYGCTGAAHGVVKFDAQLDRTATQGAIIGTFPRTIDHLLANDLPVPGNGGLSRTASGASGGTTALPENIASTVQFSAAAGSSDNNAAYFDFTVKGNGATGYTDRVIFTVEMLADKDCTLRLAFYPNKAPVYVNLMAGQPTSVSYFAGGSSGTDDRIPVGNVTMVIYPTTANGPKLRFQYGHATSGLLADPVFFAAQSRIAGGAYNPKIAALLPRAPATAAPTDNVAPVGAVRWNAAPAAGQPAFWMHVGGGTWKPCNLGA